LFITFAKNKYFNMPEIIITSDGSHTLYVPDIDEHYHSINGAIQESLHIFINNGFNAITTNPVNILEIGFGTGLNALLTAISAEKTKREVFYTAVEKYPLPETITDILNYETFLKDAQHGLFKQIHQAAWNCNHKISQHFTIRKVQADAVKNIPEGKYHIIYFDAFAPDKQPEMWTKEMFEKISSSTLKSGVFVTYSAKGEVKRNLKSCGFDVTILPGPPGKRHIIRGVKKDD
jgi:tRNA U34 5-methylaminomethyl-2-thiouridine-forming methyltransferase MnmC